MLFVLTFAVVLLAAADAPPAPPAPPPAASPTPDIRPSQKVFEVAYAEGSFAGLTEGSATLDCTVRDDGFLRDCEVAAESAAGFGRAVMRMRNSYRYTRSLRKAGSAPGDRVRIVATLRAPDKSPAEGPDGPMLMDQPQAHLQIPTGDQVSRFYPDRALRQEVEGYAVLRCVVLASGRLTDCEVLYEGPPDMGFGEAAVTIATKFYLVTPPLKDGMVVEGYPVIAPLAFRLP